MLAYPKLEFIVEETTYSQPSSDQPGRWLIWWEDLHPATRYSVAILAFQAGMWLIMNLLTYAAPRFLSYKQVFNFAILERLGTIISLILIAIVIYNSARVVQRYWEKVANLTSVILSLVAGVGLIIVALNMPSFLKGTIGHNMGASYPSVFSDFRGYCDEWQETYGQQATVAIRPDDLDLGIFNDETRVDVYRIGSGETATVIFQMGDEEQRFGLACVLGTGESPYNLGRASDFDYVHWGKNYYGFVENKDQ